MKYIKLFESIKAELDASKKGNINKVDPSINNNYAIRYAALNGDVELVKTLLQDPRVDPSDNDNSTIRHAALGGHDLIVYLLLNHPKVYQSLTKEEREKYAKGKPVTIDVIKKLNENKYIKPVNELLSNPKKYLEDLGYDIITSLGSGQQGDVYLTNNEVAVKIIILLITQ